jgi:hypothetical protein
MQGTRGGFFGTVPQLKCENFRQTCVKIVCFKLPMGKPMAKSLLWVQKMAKSPALPRFTGRLISSVMMPTPKNTTALAISKDNKNFQFTELKFQIKI